MGTRATATMDRWGGPTRTLASLGLMVAVFLLAYLLPFEALPASGKVSTAGREALLMLQDYAREHVLLCLVPALFIAGAISCFVSQATVMKYFGVQAHKAGAYAVAAISGTILAACSCTILPPIRGHIQMWGRNRAGDGLPLLRARNQCAAITLTARVLGWQLGLARAIGAIVFSVIIGLSMHLIFRKEEAARHAGSQFVAPEEDQDRPLWQTVLYFAAMIGVLVFANWGRLGEDGIAATIWAAKWYLTGGSLVGLTVMLALWFKRPRISDYGVLMTPGLVIDGQVKFSGKVPDDAKLRAILSE